MNKKEKTTTKIQNQKINKSFIVLKFQNRNEGKGMRGQMVGNGD